MKTTLFLAALLSCASLGYAQTTPSATPAATTAGSTQQASGTKNVGSDRADAPQAPGMQASGTTPISSGRLHSTKAGQRRSAKKAASGQRMAPQR